VTPEARAQRAVALRALLEDETVKDALASIEADLIGEWKTCFDAAERQNLWLSVRLLDRLTAWMASGASHDLTALRRSK
jgi:hypothetical protein